MKKGGLTMTPKVTIQVSKLTAVRIISQDKDMFRVKTYPRTSVQMASYNASPLSMVHWKLI